jgi:hypothetical protein
LSVGGARRPDAGRDCIPTPKNDVIVKLYPSLGFTEVERPAPANGAKR